ncbi:MAG: cache domain-containing protein [Deltaproteobacteria bacterium]|nr:cache domain-containing protein [Deltaproteobacteria bacterium]
MPDDKLSPYTYEDTKRLVTLVEEAATLVEQQGEEAFKEFERKDSKWFNETYYLFVYTEDGTCVFHAVEPELVDRNVIDLRDMDGKPVVQLITDFGKKPENDAGGWVFYLWGDKTQLIPHWKSAYIRKVVAPNQRIYLVGSGIYNIKIEKVFIEERVKMACELLQSKGKDAAFKEFRDPASSFVFLGTYIFVLDEQGHTLVDPAYPTLAGRDLSQFQDVVGLHVIKEVLQKLTRADEAWVQYLWPRPGSAVPSRKLMYTRRIKVGSETLIVGSDFFLATPIWMKVEGDSPWPKNPPV